MKNASSVAGFRRIFAAISIIFTVAASQAIAQEAITALPIQRTLTATDGRKLDVTITDKSSTAIKGKTVAGKEFTLELTKLSAEDQAFIAGLAAPAAPPVRPRTALLMGGGSIVYPVPQTGIVKPGAEPELVSGSTDTDELHALLKKAGFTVTKVNKETLAETQDGKPSQRTIKYNSLAKYTDDQLKGFDLIWVLGCGQDKTKTRLTELIPTFPGIVVWPEKWGKMTKANLINKDQLKQSEFAKSPIYMKADGNVIFYSRASIKYNTSIKRDELLERKPEMENEVIAEARRLLDAPPTPKK